MAQWSGKGTPPGTLPKTGDTGPGAWAGAIALIAATALSVGARRRGASRRWRPAPLAALGRCHSAGGRARVRPRSQAQQTPPRARSSQTASSRTSPCPPPRKRTPGTNAGLCGTRTCRRRACHRPGRKQGPREAR
ncbi:MAG: LPXTG cell wall anchor domain-containing protein [Olsenella sp.]|nr:LPXTG cell wall anchor domain-containing protein [Olsenella sp.]